MFLHPLLVLGWEFVARVSVYLVQMAVVSFVRAQSRAEALTTAGSPEERHL